MRDYFKYERGYVNLDDENLYLTNTGNWTEVVELVEKTGKSKIANSARQYSNILFFSVVALAFVLVLLFNLAKGKISLLLLFLVPLGIFSLYRYLQRDMGVRYKIPISKIDSFELNREEKQIRIAFHNGDNLLDSEILSNVEDKGFEKLAELKLAL